MVDGFRFFGENFWIILLWDFEKLIIGRGD